MVVRDATIGPVGHLVAEVGTFTLNLDVHDLKMSLTHLQMFV